MNEDEINALVAEAEGLTAYEFESSAAYALRASGDIGDCKIFVVNFKDRYATMYSKDSVKPMEIKNRK